MVGDKSYPVLSPYNLTNLLVQPMKISCCHLVSLRRGVILLGASMHVTKTISIYLFSSLWHDSVTLP